MLILGIETSCDDTSVAILQIKDGKPEVLANIVSSQIATHTPYGGVVPLLAAREHEKNLPIVLAEALAKADREMPDIDLIAVTSGPGLIMSLVRGVNFAKELAHAQKAIGILEGSHDKLKNSFHLIGPLVAKEATVSSRIEGTQSTSADVYIYDAGGSAAHADTPVVSNYNTAMFDAIGALLEGRPFSLHLLKSLHKTLLEGARHKGKLGDFRDEQVWIAEKEGDPIEIALYIPPIHTVVPSYMENLFEYIKENKDDLELVKAGVAHYQFEAVHPFMDGNGRIGRLLIPLILFYNKELPLPIIYSSGYFEARSDEYRAALRTVDVTGKFEQWLKFFLSAITEQAHETIGLINRIQALNIALNEKFRDSKSPYMSRFIDFLFESPVFTLPLAIDKIKFDRITGTRLLSQLVTEDVIHVIPDQKGPRGTKLYAYRPLLKLIA